MVVKIGSATSGSAVEGTGSAAPIADVAVPIAAAGPWTMPAGATAGSADADATGLGSAVVVHFVEHVVKPKPHEKTRTVKLLLVLEGGGKTIIADETGILGADDRSPAAMATKVESDIILAPLTPPRPLQGSDIDGGGDYELDFKGPLLFLVHLKPKAEVFEVAVGKVNDSLVVWLLQIPFDDVDAVPEWDVTGTIKLAPGAVVTAAGSGS